jgi:paraquat-inducible protein B
MVSLVGAIQGATGSYAVALLPIVALALTGALVVLVIGARGARVVSEGAAAAE